jgi:hypothetical protein
LTDEVVAGDRTDVVTEAALIFSALIVGAV